MALSKYNRRALPVLRETPGWSDFFEVLTDEVSAQLDFSMLSVNGFPSVLDLSKERIPILIEHKVLKQSSLGYYTMNHDFDSVDIECVGCAVFQTTFDKPRKTATVKPPFNIEIYDEDDAFIKTKQPPNQIDFHSYLQFYKNNVKALYSRPCLSPAQLYTQFKYHNIDASIYAVFNEERVPEIGTKEVPRKNVIDIIPLDTVNYAETDLVISHLYDKIQGANIVDIVGIDKGLVVLSESVREDTNIATPQSDAHPEHKLMVTPGDEREIVLPHSVEGTTLRRTKFWSSVSSFPSSDSILIVLQDKSQEDTVRTIMKESLPLGISYTITYMDIKGIEETLDITEETLDITEQIT